MFIRTRATINATPAGPHLQANRLLDKGLQEIRKAGLEAFEKHWDNDDDEAWNAA